MEKGNRDVENIILFVFLFFCVQINLIFPGNVANKYRLTFFLHVEIFNFLIRFVALQVQGFGPI